MEKHSFKKESFNIISLFIYISYGSYPICMLFISSDFLKFNLKSNIFRKRWKSKILAFETMRGRKLALTHRRSGIIPFDRLPRCLFCIYICGLVVLVISLLHYHRPSHQQIIDNNMAIQSDSKATEPSIVEHSNEAKVITTSSDRPSVDEGATLKATDAAQSLSRENVARIKISNGRDLSLLNVKLVATDQRASDITIKTTTSQTSKASMKRRQRNKAKKARKEKPELEAVNNDTKLAEEKKAQWARIAASKQHAMQVAQMLRNKTVPELRAIVEQAQNKFDNDEIISVRGFYSSGTNWLRALILHNCKNMTFEKPIYPPFANGTKLDTDGLYGWKHGLFLQREIARLASRMNHKLVIISREAPTWAISAWKMYAMANTRYAKMRTKPPRSSGNATQEFRVSRTFVNGTRIRARGTPDNATQIIRPIKPIVVQGAYGNFSKYINMHKVNETSIYGKYLEVYYDKDLREMYRIVNDNVLGARTQVYRNWMSLLNNKNVTRQVYFLRYEDLLASPYIEFQQLLHFLNIKTCTVTDEESFDTVRSRVKYHVEDKRINFEGRHPRKEFCSIVSTQGVYESILSKIDRDFDLKVLGYEYPDTLEEYCHVVDVPPKR